MPFSTPTGLTQKLKTTIRKDGDQKLILKSTTRKDGDQKLIQHSSVCVKLKSRCLTKKKLVIVNPVGLIFKFMNNRSQFHHLPPK